MGLLIYYFVAGILIYLFVKYMKTPVVLFFHGKDSITGEYMDEDWCRKNLKISTEQVYYNQNKKFIDYRFKVNEFFILWAEGKCYYGVPRGDLPPFLVREGKIKAV